MDIRTVPRVPPQTGVITMSSTNNAKDDWVVTLSLPHQACPYRELENEMRGERGVSFFSCMIADDDAKCVEHSCPYRAKQGEY